MSKNLIEIKNKGIHVLRKKFNQNFRYEAEHKYYEKDNIIYVEEHNRIDIYTDYNNVDDIFLLAKDIRLTDIFTIFNSIAIHSKINGFHFREDGVYFIQLSSMTEGQKLEHIETIAFLSKK